MFATFLEPIYGLRALAKLLMRYYFRYGLTTVAGILGRYAPASENATQKYVDFVVGSIGTQEIPPAQFRARLPALMGAIVQFENGQNPYPPEVYEDALLLAEETA